MRQRTTESGMLLAISIDDGGWCRANRMDPFLSLAHLTCYEMLVLAKVAW